MKQLRVLVAEDEEFMAQVWEIMLRSLGHIMVKVEQGSEAIEMLTKDDTSVDVFICDLRLADMDGEEVMQQLRTAGCNTPIVAASGMNIDEVADELMTKYGVRFLGKPFDRDELDNVLEMTMADQTSMQLAIG